MFLGEILFGAASFCHQVVYGVLRALAALGRSHEGVGSILVRGQLCAVPCGDVRLENERRYAL